MPTKRSMRVLAPALFAVLSCSDPTAVLIPTSIALVSGSGQAAVVTAALPLPVVVEVKDAEGRVVRGAAVTWNVTTGGGSVSAATTNTNGSGRAEVTWTLGTTAGTHTLNARTTGVGPTSVIATAQPGAPTSLTIVAGNNQTAPTNATLSDLLAFAVRDAHGNGIAGVAVTFVAGTGTVAASNPTTDAAGIARAQWTLGQTSGEQTADGSAAGLAGQTVRFTATALSLDDVPTLENGVSVPGIASALGVNRYFRVNVPANTMSLAITTVGGPGDADMYVRYGALPTTTGTNVCTSLSPSATETCTINAPAEGGWFVLLDAYSAYSNVTLRASYVVGGSLTITTTGLPASATPGIHVTGAGYDRTVQTGSFTTPLLPGNYTVTASHVSDGSAVYAASPEVQQVQVVSGAGSSVTVAYAATTGGLNLDIVGTYITQAVQRRDGSIQLIAGRDGLLRVFARGNAVSSETPAVRAQIYHGGTLVHTRTIPAPSSSVPISHDEGELATTWNAYLPGALIQPGMSVLIDIDPTNGVSETDESDNVYPASGSPLALSVRSVPTLEATLIPVIQSGNSLQGDVTAANSDTYVALAQALYPLSDIDVQVRAPYTFTGVLASQYDSTWIRLLVEVNALRMAEAPNRYYYGVIKPAYTSGGTGFGYIGQRAAVGVDWVGSTNWRAETVAHEWGHNFGRQHVACGGPSNPDQNYPYENGGLGHHGYDMRTNEIRNLGAHHDLMSYCQPTWSSDYTYEAVMSFRGTQAGAQGSVAAQPSLIVWGHVSPDGVVLEPSYETVTRPSLPAKGGRYRLTGVNDAGVKVLDMTFDGYAIDHMPGVRAFSYAIPLSALGGETPSRLLLEAEGVEVERRRTSAGAGSDDVRVERTGADKVRLQWNAARNPMIVVRDGRTGAILSFARGGDVQVTSNAAEIEVNMSDGVKSTIRRLRVTR